MLARIALTRRLSLWAPVVVYMGAIFVVSAVPSAPLPEAVPDKLGHGAAYFVLGVLSVRAVGGGLPCRLTPSKILWALAIASGYGAFDEWHQSLVPGRTADVADWIADSVGAVIGLLACWAWGIMAARSNGRTR